MANYTKKQDGLIGVENSQARYQADGSFAPRNGIQGTAKEKNPEKHDGKLGVKLPPFTFWWAPYDVIYTDYDNMAIVHSCVSLGFYKMEQQWVLHRKPLTPDADGPEYDAVTAKAKEVLEGELTEFKFEERMRATV